MEFERIFGLLDVTADFRTCVPRWKQLLKINRLGTDQWKLRRLSYCKREFGAEDEREFLLLEFSSTPDLPTAKICVEHLPRAKFVGNGAVVLLREPVSDLDLLCHTTMPYDTVSFFIPGSKQEKKFETAHQPYRALSTSQYPEGIVAPTALQMSLLFCVASTATIHRDPCHTQERCMLLPVITGCLSKLFPTSAVEGSAPRGTLSEIEEAVQHNWEMEMVRGEMHLALFV